MSRRRLVIALAVALLLLGDLTPFPPIVRGLAASTRVAQSPPSALGVNAYLMGDGSPEATAFNEATLNRADEAGFGWVRFQLVWRDFERAPGAYDWGPLDARIAAATAHGQRIILTVAKAPTWAAPFPPGALPAIPGDLFLTLAAVATRYRGQIGAYEIWNEENLGGEDGGDIDVSAYYRTLKASYKAIKAVDPTALVLLGGLAPATDGDPLAAFAATTFLARFYAFKGGDGAAYFDALAVHA